MEMLNTFKTGKSFLSRKIYLYSTLALMAGGGGEATYSLCLYVGNGIKISFTCTSPEGVGGMPFTCTDACNLWTQTC